MKYEVFLDADGKVLGMNKVSKSMDIDYDKAVEAAIRRAAPYPPAVGTKISLQFGITLKKAARTARNAKKTLEQPAPGPDEEPGGQPPKAG